MTNQQFSNSALSDHAWLSVLTRILIIAIQAGALLTACGPSARESGTTDAGTGDAANQGDATRSDGQVPPDGSLLDATRDSGTDASLQDGQAPDGCQPSVTCQSAGWQCGRLQDGCGNLLDCGDCTAPAQCQEGRCVDQVTCEPNAAFCLDQTSVARCNAAGNGTSATWNCPAGSFCEDGGCIGPVAWHLARTVDMQYVQAHLLNGGLDTLNQCTNTADDLAHSRLLCDIRRSVQTLQARFALFYGNTWTQFQPDPNDPCKTDLGAWKACIRDRLRGFIHELHAASPAMLVACSLAEYVHSNNVPTGDFPAICVPGSVGAWGPNTCIPDAANSPVAQAYFEDWATLFLDAGCRALLFQQARLTFGGDPNSSQLSATGASALAQVLAPIRSHAASMGATIYIGLQAAGGAVSGGRQEADFVMGAQHLETVGGYLLQPLCVHGPFLNSHYGEWDWHDANLINDANGLPVILDYDNYSSDPNVPDDIRLLASQPNDTQRARVFEDHWRHLHTYNPKAYLSVPLSKTLGNATGVTCYGMNQWQFSASKCGLLDTAKDLFDHPDVTVTVPAGQTPPIRPSYWGRQLLGRDETVSWLYEVFLGRIPSGSEYQNALGALPEIVDSSGSARCDFAWSIVSSSEYSGLADSDSVFVDKTYRALLLREADQGGHDFYVNSLSDGTKTRRDVVYDICNSQEAQDLYRHP